MRSAGGAAIERHAASAIGRGRLVLRVSVLVFVVRGWFVMLRVWCGGVVFDARRCWGYVGMRVRVDVDGAVVIGASPGAMVDEDGVAAPAEARAVPAVDSEGRTDDDGWAETDSRGDHEAGGRCVEDDCGIVDGNVVVGRIDGLDFDGSAVVHYVVVGRVGEIAVVVRGLTLTLNGVHDVVSLNENGVTERAGPWGIAGHHVEDGGKGEKGEDAGVPGEIVGLDSLGKRVAGEVGVVLGPGGCIGDLLPEGCSGEDLGEKRVRVEGYPLDELIELLRGDRWGKWGLLLVRWLRLGAGGRRGWWGWRRLVLRVRRRLLVGCRGLANDGGLGE
jgi:hypothetical protein